MKPRPVEWFKFDDQERPVLMSVANPLGEQLHPFKFVFARHFNEANNPYGLRLLSHCLWPVAFKRGGMRFWLTFCEKFGQPHLIGKVQNNAAPAERAQVLASLSALVQDAVAVVTQGTEIEPLEVKSTGEVHPTLIAAMDSAIAQVLMGQTLTAEIGKTGSYAAAQTHYGVLEDYRDADEQMVVTAMNELAWIYGQVNAPGALAPTFGYREPEDYLAKAELDRKLKDNGVKFRKIHFVREYGLVEEDFEVEGI